MLEKLNDYDWEEVFKYANPTAVLVEEKINTDEFTREDVSEIIAIEDGCNDEEEWVGVFKLKDGRYVSLRAGCDYTGWG